MGGIPIDFRKLMSARSLPGHRRLQKAPAAHHWPPGGGWRYQKTPGVWHVKMIRWIEPNKTCLKLLKYIKIRPNMANEWHKVRREAIQMRMPHARTCLKSHLKTEQQLLASNFNKTQVTQAAKLPRCRQRDALPIQCAWRS